MGLADEIKKNQEQINTLSAKEKFRYYWYYYKGYVLLIGGTILLIVGILLSVLLKKEAAINGVFLNPYSHAPYSSIETFTDDFLMDQQIDAKQYAFTVNTSLYYSVKEDSNVDNMTASQTLITQVSRAKLDFILGDQETMVSIAYSDFFVDLSQVLSEEQFALFEPYMLYIDQSVLDILNAEGASDISSVTIPDVNRPDKMEKPVPILIDLSSCTYLDDFYVHVDEPIVLGCIHNAPHRDLVAELIAFMMNH